MATAVVLPTQQRVQLELPAGASVADIQARAATLCGVPASHLVAFPCAPLASDGAAAELLHLAIGHAPMPSTLGSDGRVRPLVSLLAEHRSLVERVSRMHTALTLSQPAADDESDALATTQLTGELERLRVDESALRPTIDAAELEMRLRVSERRAEKAERRVIELERQLAESRLSLSPQIVVRG